MRLPIGSILFLSLAVPSILAQVSSESAFDAARIEQVLKEAGELQSTEPQSVAERLAPVLNQLRQIRDSGRLQQDTSRILKDALVLMMRTQTMLLAPEQDVLAFIRELLVTDPKIDEGTFNPREKLLLKKLRSAETGSLSLETNPQGAVLLYQGAELGASPGTFEFIAGNYRLQLRMPGYVDQSVDLTIQPAEVKSMSFTMRRRVVDIPIAINAPSTSIRVNGKNLGSSQEYKSWSASLPAEQKSEYESLIGQWKIDTSGYSFFRFADAPVGESMRLEFQAACYEPLVLDIKIADQDVDWAKSIYVAPQLKGVQLTKDTGSIDVSSTPSGAEVWIDGSLQGQTPLGGKEFCSGVHRIQVLHGAGQYVQEVVIQRGRAIQVRGELKPALAFLGIYERNPKNSELTLAVNESKNVAKSLSLNCRVFADPLVSAEDMDSLRRKGSLPVDQLLREKDFEDAQIKKASAAVGRSELLLIGLHSASGYLFRLFSTMQPIPDSMEIAALDNTNIDFLIAQLNATDKVRSHLQAADPGVELFDSPRGVIVSKTSSAVSSRAAALVPGTLVKSIDEKAMSSAGFHRYLRSKNPEQTIIFEVQTNQGKMALVQVPLRRAGAEYPWSTPDGFLNSVLVTLHQIAEREPLSEEAKFANLSIALGLMRQKEWRLALEYLAKANLELQRSGISAGTVLYYQGRCYEELGNRAQAETYYVRAKDYGDATLGTPDGLSIPVLADQRIQSLKKQ